MTKDDEGPTWTMDHGPASTTIYQEMNRANAVSSHVCGPKSKKREQGMAKVDSVDMFIVMSNIKYVSALELQPFAGHEQVYQVRHFGKRDISIGIEECFGEPDASRVLRVW